MHAALPLEHLSRRQFVGYGAASVVLTSAATKAQNAPPGVPLPPSPTQGDFGTVSEKPLTINVQINGKGPFRFVVDTGADRTVVAEDIATALGLSRGGPVMVEGVVRTVPAETVQLDDITFGPITRENLRVPLLPRSQLLVDGYLGLDAIDGYRVTLDFKNRALVVSEPRHALLLNWAPPNEALVPVSGHLGHLRAFNCLVDGVRATAFVDTGAEVSVGNSSLYDALVQRDPSHVTKDTLPLTGVTGGIINGRLTTIRQLRLSALTFEQCEVAIANLQIFDLWGLARTPSLLIGMNWLRQFSYVSIDYARKELRFDLAKLAAMAHRA